MNQLPAQFWTDEQFEQAIVEAEEQEAVSRAVSPPQGYNIHNKVNLINSGRNNNMITEPRNVLLSNVQLNWAKLSKPITNQFGATQYELQAVALTKEEADKIVADTGIKCKEKDGQFIFNLKRKAFKADKTENTPVRVVDASKSPYDGSIGNGSIGDVVVWQAPYDFNGVKGVSSSLTAVMVKELVEYKPNNDPLAMFGESAPVATPVVSEAVPQADLF